MVPTMLRMMIMTMSAIMLPAEVLSIIPERWEPFLNAFFSACVMFVSSHQIMDVPESFLLSLLDTISRTLPITDWNRPEAVDRP